MSRYIEIDNPRYCPNIKVLYDDDGVAITRVCEKLWYTRRELKECNSSQFPEYCMLKKV